MAGFFDSAQKALAQGLSVFFGELYEIHFLSGTQYYWDGFGDLLAYSHTWLGRGQFVQRSEIPFGVDDEAGEVSLTLSGVDDVIVAAVRAEEAEFYNRPIIIWGQFFDEALQLSGGRFQLFSGTMDVPTYSGDGPSSRTVVVPCEGEWADRNGAQFEFFSHGSQMKRFPGPPPDLGLEYVHRYTADTRRRWPDFD